MTTFSNGESGSSVRTKINAAITTVDGLGTGDNLLMTAAERTKLGTVATNADVSPVASVAGLTGTVSAAGLRTALNVEDGATADQTADELRGAVRTITGDSSAANTDNNGWILVNGNHTVTLPAGLTVGTAVAIVAFSSSPTVTIAAGSGATVNKRSDQALTIGTQWAQAVATVIATDTWLVAGGLDAA